MRLQTTAWLVILLASMHFIACNGKADADEQGSKSEQATSKEEGVDPGNTADHLRMYYKGLHPADQKRFFSSLPPEMKHALWQSHLQAVLKDAKNDEERNFIRDAIARLKPEYYSDSVLYQKEGEGYFSAQAGKLFTVFGNDSARAAGVMYKIGGDENAKRILQQAAQPACICSMVDDWCGKGMICSPDNCTPTIAGCGWWGLKPCDGWCLHRRPDQE